LPPRSYFYHDTEGNLKKFAYCSMCGSGPFKESEKNYKYLAIGDKNANNYCLTCVKSLRLSEEGLVNKKEVVEKEIVTEVFYSDMSTVKAPVIGFDYLTSEGESAPRKLKDKFDSVARPPKKTKTKTPKVPLTREKVKEIIQQIPPLFGEVENIDLSLFKSKDDIKKPFLIPPEDYLEEDELLISSPEEYTEKDEVSLSSPVEEEILSSPSIKEIIEEEKVLPPPPVEEVIEKEPLPPPPVEEVIEKEPLPPPPIEEIIEKEHLPSPPVEKIVEDKILIPIIEEEPLLVTPQKIPEKSTEFIPPPFLHKKDKEGIISSPIIENHKEEIGPFYVYIGQFADDTFTVNMAKDINEDIKIINSFSTKKSRKLPIEIVFYITEENKNSAIKTLKAIRSMSVIQKELLVKTFSQNFFKK
jgi:predicted GIY-YIG superfamily endonuclease